MSLSLQGRRFGAGSCVWSFREDRDGTVTGTYAGGDVLAGSLVGRRDGRDLSYAWSQLGRNGFTSAGSADVLLTASDSGLVRLPWGELVLEELPEPRWLRTRLARPTHSVAAAVAFYGDLLGFAVDGPHDAAPYQLVIFALPGGAQLELTTAGGPELVAAEDLLVLYLSSAADVAEARSRLAAAGVEAAPSSIAYWDQVGFTVLDPDGRRLAVVHPPT